MKITTDLRLAIKAAEKAQPSIYQAKKEAESLAVQSLLKRRNKSITKAHARVIEARKELDQALNVFKKFSVDEELKGIWGEKNFVKSGGKLPQLMCKWSYEQVMRELAGAEESQMDSILSKYGIIWK